MTGRMGHDHYSEAFGKAVFDVAKPLQTLGIGVDKLADNVRLSEVLTGNDLGQLANIESLPDEKEILEVRNKHGVDKLLSGAQDLEKELHLLTRDLISHGKIWDALCIVMITDI